MTARRTLAIAAAALLCGVGDVLLTLGSEGSGLRGLSDRVAALNGTFEVSSPPGSGTRLRAHLPCT
jgi:signal transduction histidine kinase